MFGFILMVMVFGPAAALLIQGLIWEFKEPKPYRKSYERPSEEERLAARQYAKEQRIKLKEKERKKRADERLELARRRAQWSRSYYIRVVTIFLLIYPFGTLALLAFLINWFGL